MTTDPRAALETLTAAFERHLEACASRRGDNDPTVVAAYQELAEAFELYDEALDEAYDEVTPLAVYDTDVDDFDDEDDDEDDDDEQGHSVDGDVPEGADASLLDDDEDDDDDVEEFDLNDDTPSAGPRG